MPYSGGYAAWSKNHAEDFLHGNAQRRRPTIPARLPDFEVYFLQPATSGAC